MINQLFSVVQKNCSLKLLFVGTKIDQYVNDENLCQEVGNIEVCMTAKQAKIILAQHDSDVAVVVADLQMPEEDGLNLLVHVKEHYPNIIRVLFSDCNAPISTAKVIQAINDCSVHRVFACTTDFKQLGREVKIALDLYFKGICEQSRHRDPVLIYDRFRASCDSWTLYNVDLSQEVWALDYGLCGILHEYRNKVLGLPNVEEGKKILRKMEDYVDNIMFSAALFSQTRIDGQTVLSRFSEHDH